MPIAMRAVKAKLNASGALPPEVLKALKDAGDRLEEDYRQVTKTWHHKPDIERQEELSSSKARVVVGSSDRIYSYVTKGTPAHRICPRRAKRLRFREGYRSKTTPGVVGSQAGGSHGGEVFSAGVSHPGTEKRDFENAIVDKESSWFCDRMNQAFRDAARRTGGG